MIQVPGEIEPDYPRCQHAPQNLTWFKTYKMVISGIFHLVWLTLVDWNCRKQSLGWWGEDYCSNKVIGELVRSLGVNTWMGKRREWSERMRWEVKYRHHWGLCSKREAENGQRCRNIWEDAGLYNVINTQWLHEHKESLFVTEKYWKQSKWSSALCTDEEQLLWTKNLRKWGTK
jgi:hypothetical protein